MSTPYRAQVKHEGLIFMGEGVTDGEAVSRAVVALETAWGCNTNSASLIVRLGDSVQYVTTVGRYRVDTN